MKEFEIHPDLLAARKLAYEPSGLTSGNFVMEAENKEYGAADFDLDRLRVKFRVGKITPTKIGQFVTLWKRVGNGPIQPFDEADPFDLFVISVHTPYHFGQFVFPKPLLCQKGIVSNEGRKGKLAMRIYPPWDKVDSLQAKKTQTWQLAYFFEILPVLDVSSLQKIFNSLQLS